MKYDIGKSIVWKKDSLGFAGISDINILNQVLENLGRFFITVSCIGKDQFMWDFVFFTDISKSFDTSVGWNLRRKLCVNMNEYISSDFCQKTGCLHPAHVVVCIDTADILIFSFDCYDRNIIGGEFTGWYRMTENDHSFNLVGKELLDIFSLICLLVISCEYKKLVAKSFVSF